MTRSPNARRRPRGPSNASTSRNTIRPPDTRRSNGNGTTTPHKPAAVPARTEVGMSPVSRYNSNLRILRRRDPNILCIFDQFPHACAYYYSISEQKWERMGYEGALFLFERSVEPKYGFFILNRAGMEDYIQYLVPSDNLAPQGQYLCIESQPSTADGVHGSPDIDRLPSTISLWTLPSDTRESLSDVMVRLLDCVKKGVPYPQEFRYKPEMVVRSTFIPASYNNEDDEDTSSDSDDEEIYHDALSASASTNSVVKRALDDARGTSHTQAGSSELDQLFAKLTASTSTLSQDVTSGSTSSMAAQTRQTTSSATTANSILEMLTRGSQSPSVSQAPLTGQALLNNMFASVASPAEHSAQNLVPPQSQNFAQFRFPSATATITSPPQDMEILSPKPNNAALPQILTADVIHELMGMPSSSSRSTSRISTSTSEHSHSTGPAQSYQYAQNPIRPRTPSSAGAPRSKERGYIADRGEDDGGVSEASTGIDGEPVGGHQAAQNGGLGSRTLGARPSFFSATSTGSMSSLKGDVTPRARQGRGLEPMPSHLSLNSQKAGRPGLSQSVSDAVVAGPSGRAVQSALERTAISVPERMPFQAGSELWPETQDVRASNEKVNRDGKADEIDGIMELDFRDIRVLDDPRAFEAKSAGGRGKDKGKGKEKDRGRTETAAKPKEGERERVNRSQASVPSSPPANAKERQRGKTTKRERERQAANTTPAHEHATPSETASLPRNLTNGNSSPSITVTSKRTAHSANSSTVAPELIKGVILNEAARSGIFSKSEGQAIEHGPSGLTLDKNTFMQQVLTLIHTDKSFVDRLYQGYLDRA